MDGVKDRNWRYRRGTDKLREVVRHEHTREVKDIPQDVLDRIAALEAAFTDMANAVATQNIRIAQMQEVLSRPQQVQVQGLINAAGKLPDGTLIPITIEMVKAA